VFNAAVEHGPQAVLSDIVARYGTLPPDQLAPVFDAIEDAAVEVDPAWARRFMRQRIKVETQWSQQQQAPPEAQQAPGEDPWLTERKNTDRMVNVVQHLSQAAPDFDQISNFLLPAMDDLAPEVQRALLSDSQPVRDTAALALEGAARRRQAIFLRDKAAAEAAKPQAEQNVKVMSGSLRPAGRGSGNVPGNESEANIAEFKRQLHAATLTSVESGLTYDK
jgi:hypothetical protein